jgi:antitoxin MazE
LRDHRRRAYIQCRYRVRPMRRRVQKWGNSLAVRIPADVARACALGEGTALEVRRDGERVVLIPERRRPPRYELSELVSGITRRNRPAPVDFGRRVGREAW